MKVRWTNAAVDTNFSGYAARTSSVYAERLVDRLIARSEQAGALPQSGRMVPEYQDPTVRELIERPYRIVYRIRPDLDRVDVLTVLHGARRPVIAAPS